MPRGARPFSKKESLNQVVKVFLDIERFGEMDSPDSAGKDHACFTSIPWGASSSNQISNVSQHQLP